MSIVRPEPVAPIINRRTFIKSGSLFMGSLMSGNISFAMNGDTAPSLYMPDESHPHKRTWMAFVANDYIWSRRQVPEVKRNLALIANTIAKYEPVSMLVSPGDYAEAETLLNQDSSAFPIELIKFDADDLWLRDTGPTFVTNTKAEIIAIDFNFNGWGNKQEHSRDKKIARFIADKSNVILAKSNIVLEGGCFEVDGNGTAIMTKSCILNRNRNPYLAQKEIEQELKSLLGLRKIIWLKGIKGKDITDGHTDFYARFIRPGEVIVHRDNYKASYDYAVTRENIEILSHSTDADGKPLKLNLIDTPDVINKHFGVNDFAAGYIGYYICNGAVIAQKFGDKYADSKAKTILRDAFPGRVIEQIAIDGIASGGGSIHCTTQQEISA